MKHKKGDIKLDLSKRKELLEEKQLLLKEKKSIEDKIKNINEQLEALAGSSR